jgi:hypothetical protein
MEMRVKRSIRKEYGIKYSETASSQDGRGANTKLAFTIAQVCNLDYNASVFTF